MDRIPVIENMSAVLEAQFALPTITYWNRLESRPRADNFERALRAEVRDPLWMLCKQWQMGEFQGDDAGSPVKVKVHTQLGRLAQPGAGPNRHCMVDGGVPGGRDFYYHYLL